MERRELLVTVPHGQRLRRLDKTARTLGVFLNIHRFASLSLPLRPEGTDAASSLGFRAAALTFLNRPAVVAIIL
jgi:hypothetical protein